MYALPNLLGNAFELSKHIYQDPHVTAQGNLDAV